MLKNIVDQLTAIAGSVGFFSVGAEGSGKSTLKNGLESACPEIVGIGFSSVLADYLNVYEVKDKAREGGPQYSVAIEQARKAMSRRDKKSINRCLLAGALRHALEPAYREEKTAFDVDGWPRTDDQSLSTPKIVYEFFPDCLLIVIEAICPREVAFDRAVSRRGETDTVAHITRCHEEYFGQLDQMRSTYGQWAHHIKIDTSGSKEQTLQNLEDSLSGLVSELQQKSSQPKIASGSLQLIPA